VYDIKWFSHSLIKIMFAHYEHWTLTHNLSQDALSSAHFTQEVCHYSFINLALYIDTLDNLSPTTPLLIREIPLWDELCKKLKGHTEVSS